MLNVTETKIVFFVTREKKSLGARKQNHYHQVKIHLL